MKKLIGLKNNKNLQEILKRSNRLTLKKNHQHIKQDQEKILEGTNKILKMDDEANDHIYYYTHNNIYN